VTSRRSDGTSPPTSQPRRARKPAARAATQGVLDGFAPEPAEPFFSGPQVCAIVGITYRQLDYWARTDLVRPSLADARGSGTQRRYSYRDLVRLKVVKNLLDAGVKLQVARKAIEYLREDLGEDWATASIVLDGTNTVLARTGEDLVDLVRGGQGVLNIVPLGHVVEELARVLALEAPQGAEEPTSKSAPARTSAPRRKASGERG
jgi:DNA-binding transcriptional MerR regulator